MEGVGGSSVVLLLCLKSMEGYLDGERAALRKARRAHQNVGSCSLGHACHGSEEVVGSVHAQEHH